VKQRHPIDRDRDAACGEEAVQSPETCTAAILIDRFHIHVTHARVWLGSDDLREEALRRCIPVEDAILSALFIVDHKLYGQTDLTGPLGIRWKGAIADQITRVE
jgi:hypothetical protein